MSTQADAQPNGPEEDLESSVHQRRERDLQRLAEFIAQKVKGEPSRSEGVVDTAIRLLEGSDRGVTLTLFEMEDLLRRAAYMGFEAGLQAGRSGALEEQSREKDRARVAKHAAEQLVYEFLRRHDREPNG
jgi:hypothetical protein